jgi:hypothetical protein
MKHWINENYKTLIIAAFMIPIITVAIVSISHVTKWYGISNPVSWAIYLSIGIEIAALSALAAISANMGKKVYFPFAIVTLIQFIGNIYFAHSYIDIDSKSFQEWVGLVSPILELTGIEPTDMAGHKRFLAFFAGGMLPIISLSFLHMLVKFTEEDRMKEIEDTIDKNIENHVEAKDIVAEVSRLRLSDEDLKILEKHLLNPQTPNEELKKAVETYKEKLNETVNNSKPNETLNIEVENIKEELVLEQPNNYFNNDSQEETQKKVIEIPPPPNEKLKEEAQRYSDEVREKHTHIDDFEETSVKSELTQEERHELLVEMMKNDQELGLYDEPLDNPMIKEETSDWDVTLMDGLEDEEPFFTEEEMENILQEEPTEEEIQRNFSTIEPETENIFQDNETLEFDILVQEDLEVPEPFATEEELKDIPTPTNEPQIETFTEELIIPIEEDNQRMDIIGQNGNEGLHYDEEVIKTTPSLENDDEKKN